MKIISAKTVAAAVILTFAAQGSIAAQQAPASADAQAGGASLAFASAHEGSGFAESPRYPVTSLDAQTMGEVQGEFWPLLGAVLGISGIDIALSAYFWGAYVPSVTGPGIQCPTCYIDPPRLR